MTRVTHDRVRTRRLLAVPLLLSLVVAVAAAQPVTPKDVPVDLSSQSGRFNVISSQVFQSGGKERHIMVLQDRKTEKEFLVVMGAGVYDMTVTHVGHDGKTQQQQEDEE